MRASTAGLCAVGLLLLSAAGGAQAFYAGDLVEEALKDAQAALTAYELPQQLLGGKFSRSDVLVLATEGEEEASACGTCIKGSAKWVMDHVIGFIKEKCSKTECPKLQKMCEKAAAHPKVTFGFLLAAVRPVSLGYAWCNGKGECGKEAEETEVAFTDEEVFLAEPVNGLASAVDKEEDEGDYLAELDMDEDFSMEDDLEAKGRHACRGCIRGVTKGFMWHTIGKIKKYCATTEDPKVQKMCAAAKKHPKVAFGYLFYKLRPVEFAAGYCLGKGKCVHKKCHGDLHDEIMFDLMEDEQMSLADPRDDEYFFY